MATPVDQLIVEIVAETKELRKGLEETNRRLGQTGKQAKAALIPLGGFTKLLAAVGGVSLFRGITNTSRRFEDLEATLRAVTGSAANAKLAFDTVEEFTKTTPFQLANVTDSFIRFFQAGIEPNNENLTAFGNLAAGMGKDITQLAQATFNATTGEMEMLKQFGIKAKLMGDEIEVTFEGQTQTIERTGEAVGEFLINLGKTRFPTALQERLNTLSGAISNLGDNTSIFANRIGTAGLNEALTNLAKSLQDIVAGSGGLADALGAGLGGAINFLVGTLSFLDTGFKKISMAINTAEIAILNFDSGILKALKSAREFFGFDSTDLDKGLIHNLEQVSNLQDENIELAEKMRNLELKRQFDAGGGLIGPILGTSTGKGSIKPPTGDSAKSDVSELAKAFGELDQVISEAGQTLSRDFTSAILDGKNAMQSLSDFSKAIVSEIIATFLNLAVIQPLIKSIFAPQASTGIDLIGPPRELMNPQSTPNVPVITGTISNVTSNSSGMTPIVVNQSINFATGVVPTVRAEVTKMLPDIAEVSKAAVLDANMRGGSFRRGMGR